MELVKEASKTKQILITTHNPQLLKFTEIEKILIAKRDKQGNSIIEPIQNRNDLSFYLQEEIGIDELFVDNRL